MKMLIFKILIFFALLSLIGKYVIIVLEFMDDFLYYAVKIGIYGLILLVVGYLVKLIVTKIKK